MAIPLSAMAWGIFNITLFVLSFVIIPIVLSEKNIIPLSLYFSILFIIVAIAGAFWALTATSIFWFELWLLVSLAYLTVAAAFFFYYYKHRSTKTAFQTEQVKVPVKITPVTENN